MGQAPARAGKVTLYLASELRAQRGRLDWTLERLAEQSGLPKTSVANALKPRGSITAEVFAVLCDAMGLDAGTLMKDAVEHARKR